MRALLTRIAAAAVLALLASPRPTCALYEDQVGLYDWHIDLVGHTRQHHWFEAKDSRRLILASDSILAAIDPSNSGKIVWRHHFPSGQHYSTSVVCHDEVITLAQTKSGALIQSWNARSGTLERVAFTSLTVSDPALLCMDKDKVAIFTSSQLYTLDLAAAQAQPKQWSGTHTLSQAKWTGSELWALGQSSDMRSLFIIHGKPDEVPTHLHVASDPNLRSAVLAGCSKNKYIVHQAGSKIFFTSVSLGWNTKTAEPVAMVTQRLGTNVDYQFHPVPDSCILRIDGGAQSVVLKFGIPKETVLYQGPTPLDVQMGTNNQVYIVHEDRVMTASPDSPNIATVFLSNHEISTLSRIAPSSKANEFLLMASDANLHFIKDGQHVWTRHEALASTQHAFIMDLPEPHSWEEEEEQVTNMLERWTDRWRTHLLMVLTGSIFEPRATSFRINKALVLGTPFRLIYVLDSTSGKVLRTMRLNDPIKDMRLIRNSIGSEPGLISITTKQHALTFNPFSGELATMSASPSSPITELLGHAFFGMTPSQAYKLDRLNQLLRGFSVPLLGDDQNDISLLSTYNLTLPGPVLAFAQPSAHPVASLGRVMGDRSVRYKYLSQRVLGLATNSAESEVTLQLIELVSGRILGTFVQNEVDTRMPVLLLHEEHWFILFYWNKAASSPLGWTATVVEMFAHDMETSRMASAFENNFPVLELATFALPVHDQITSLGVSVTANGISIKDIIFTTSRSVYAVSRRFLDALRSPNAKPEDQEAGLVPYSNVVPIDDRQTLSHLRHVITNCILTAPTGLESTSMVFTYGHDLFWTRITPSGAFDSLSESFAKTTLMAICLGLSAACVVSRQMLRKKLLQKQWE